MGRDERRERKAVQPVEQGLGNSLKGELDVWGDGESSHRFLSNPVEWEGSNICNSDKEVGTQKSDRTLPMPYPG